jgi:transposase
MRRLARERLPVEVIASRVYLDTATVQAFLATPTLDETRPAGSARQIRGTLTVRVRFYASKGWGASDIASILDLDPATVKEFLHRLKSERVEELAKPRTRSEQERLERRARERLEKANRPPKWVDEWRAAAADDPAYRDPITPPAMTGAPPLPAIAAAELGQLGPIGRSRPNESPEPWGSIHANAPRKVSVPTLERALELRRGGMSWPAVARVIGCHRMTLYHAFKRSGVEIPSEARGHRKFEVSAEEARGQHQAGLSWAEIARRAGCSRRTIHKAITREARESSDQRIDAQAESCATPLPCGSFDGMDAGNGGPRRITLRRRHDRTENQAASFTVSVQLADTSE